MLEWIAQFGPVSQSLMAGIFTWSITALGASIVVFSRTVSQKLLDVMLGFAAGVMIAAGTMIYVVVEELIPESHYHDQRTWQLWARLSGSS